MTQAQDKVSILIVDDKEDKLIALEAVLSDLDLNIIRARSGREALRCLLQQDFALILLDVNMPGMDGFETASLIRARESSKDTPILFITAFGDEPFVSKGYALGAVDYILTPVIPEVLRTKVTVFVELFRKARQVQQQAEKLEQRANQLAALAAELTEAEQRERRRLAQLLHDNLQQMLAAARMRVGMLDRRVPANAKIIAQIDKLLGESIEVSRSLTVQLSPPVLYDAGLPAALDWLARRMSEHHGLTVDLQTDPAADFATENLQVFAFQAIRELLFNTVKHAQVTRARVALRRCEEGIELTVADTGCGFEPSSLESAASRSEHFGLFSIRERVRLLKGRMNIESAPTRGTLISIVLPNRLAPAPVEAPLIRSPAQAVEGDLSDAIVPAETRDGSRSKQNGVKIRILLADDHDIVRKGLAALLARQPDLEVIGEAADGLAAVAMARRTHPDVVIMDISMPGMSGIEATRAIKRDYPGIRIIGLSMHKEEDMAAAMRLAGASAYLTKGGPPETLVAEIRGAMPELGTALPTAPEIDVTVSNDAVAPQDPSTQTVRLS